jgi:hypothetical protein
MAFASRTAATVRHDRVVTKMGVDPDHDMLAALEQWVEHGRAPE